MTRKLRVRAKDLSEKAGVSYQEAVNILRKGEPSKPKKEGVLLFDPYQDPDMPLVYQTHSVDDLALVGVDFQGDFIFRHLDPDERRQERVLLQKATLTEGCFRGLISSLRETPKYSVIPWCCHRINSLYQVSCLVSEGFEGMAASQSSPLKEIEDTPEAPKNPPTLVSRLLDVLYCLKSIPRVRAQHRLDRLGKFCGWDIQYDDGSLCTFLEVPERVNAESSHPWLYEWVSTTGGCFSLDVWLLYSDSRSLLGAALQHDSVDDPRGKAHTLSLQTQGYVTQVLEEPLRSLARGCRVVFDKLSSHPYDVSSVEEDMVLDGFDSNMDPLFRHLDPDEKKLARVRLKSFGVHPYYFKHLVDWVYRSNKYAVVSWKRNDDYYFVSCLLAAEGLGGAMSRWLGHSTAPPYTDEDLRGIEEVEESDPLTSQLLALLTHLKDRSDVVPVPITGSDGEHLGWDTLYADGSPCMSFRASKEDIDKCPSARLKEWLSSPEGWKSLGAWLLYPDSRGLLFSTLCKGPLDFDPYSTTLLSKGTRMALGLFSPPKMEFLDVHLPVGVNALRLQIRRTALEDETDLVATPRIREDILPAVPREIEYTWFTGSGPFTINLQDYKSLVYLGGFVPAKQGVQGGLLGHYTNSCGSHEVYVSPRIRPGFFYQGRETQEVWDALNADSTEGMKMRVRPFVCHS